MSPLTVDSFLFCSSLGIKIVCKEFSVNGFQAQIPTVVLSNIFFCYCSMLRDTCSKFLFSYAESSI